MRCRDALPPATRTPAAAPVPRLRRGIRRAVAELVLVAPAVPGALAMVSLASPVLAVATDVSGVAALRSAGGVLVAIRDAREAVVRPGGDPIRRQSWALIDWPNTRPITNQRRGRNTPSLNSAGGFTC